MQEHKVIPTKETYHSGVLEVLAFYAVDGTVRAVARNTSIELSNPLI